MICGTTAYFTTQDRRYLQSENFLKLPMFTKDSPAMALIIMAVAEPSRMVTAAMSTITISPVSSEISNQLHSMKRQGFLYAVRILSSKRMVRTAKKTSDKHTHTQSRAEPSSRVSMNTALTT